MKNEEDRRNVAVKEPTEAKQACDDGVIDDYGNQ